MIRRVPHSRQIHLDTVIEELGSTYGVTLHVSIKADATAPEPMVRYDRNGSGYPGFDGELLITDITVNAVTTSDAHVTRNERLDWFRFLDRYVNEHFTEDETLIERLAERWAEYA